MILNQLCNVTITWLFLEDDFVFQGMELIEKLDSEAFYNYLKQYKNTICGRHPISVLLCVRIMCKRIIIPLIARCIVTFRLVNALVTFSEGKQFAECKQMDHNSLY